MERSPVAGRDFYRQQARRVPQLLLVEDNEEEEALSLRAIRQSGMECNVTVRRDGDEAIEFLCGSKPPILDLVLLDFDLPKMDGLAVLTRLRQQHQTRLLPIVIFSSSHESQLMEQCYFVGVNSCISKPVDASEYVDCLAKILRYWLLVNRSAIRALSLECAIRIYDFTDGYAT